MSQTESDQSEILSYLRLYRTTNIGPITFEKLRLKFGSAQTALENLEDFTKTTRKPLKPYEQSRAEDEINALEKHGGTFLIKTDPRYPELLRHCEDAPPILAVLGNLDVLQKPAVGIVGSRNASLNGCKFTKQLAHELGSHDFSIISGLARGIDTAAHQASLTTGTIAVVAGGIDVIYPKENATLYHHILETGCIIAESPFGVEPQARHFPKRNRIISGASRGVIVVEAALRSGSLITARQALEQGREVFAVPGSPFDPRTKGTNKLLQDGAHLVTSTQDIINILSQIRYRTPQKQISLFEEEATQNDFLPPSHHINEPSIPKNENILELVQSFLSHSPVHIDELIRACDKPASEILTTILELELTGSIERHPGNRVNLI